MTTESMAHVPCTDGEGEGLTFPYGHCHRIEPDGDWMCVAACSTEVTDDIHESTDGLRYCHEMMGDMELTSCFSSEVVGTMFDPGSSFGSMCCLETAAEPADQSCLMYTVLARGSYLIMMVLLLIILMFVTRCLLLMGWRMWLLLICFMSRGLVLLVRLFDGILLVLCLIWILGMLLRVLRVLGCLRLYLVFCVFGIGLFVLLRMLDLLLVISLVGRMFLVR